MTMALNLNPYVPLLDVGIATDLGLYGCLLTQGPAQPQLELFRLNHATPGQLPVLPLAAFVPGLAPGFRRWMNVPGASVAFVLVLTSAAARPEGLEDAIIMSHTQDLGSRHKVKSKGGAAS